MGLVAWPEDRVRGGAGTLWLAARARYDGCGIAPLSGDAPGDGEVVWLVDASCGGRHAAPPREWAPEDLRAPPIHTARWTMSSATPYVTAVRSHPCGKARHMHPTCAAMARNTRERPIECQQSDAGDRRVARAACHTPMGHKTRGNPTRLMCAPKALRDISQQDACQRRERLRLSRRALPPNQPSRLKCRPRGRIIAKPASLPALCLVAGSRPASMRCDAANSFPKGARHAL